MAQANPMENVFITMVEKIVEEIFRGSADDTERIKMLESLNNHLEKAKKLGTLSYEGETHNAIALYHLVNGGRRDVVMDGFQATYDCAVQAKNLDLQTKALNNIGSTLNSEFNFSEGKEYIDRAIEIGESLRPASLSCLFAYENRITYFATRGDWDSAYKDVVAASKLSEVVRVTPATRNDYARIITAMRIREVGVNLAIGDNTAALTALRLAQGLIHQLNSSEYDLQLELGASLYALIADGDTQAYEKWHSNRASNNVELLENVVEVAVLQKMNHTPYARQTAKFVLDNVPSDEIKSKVQKMFDDLGVK